jgi:cytoskeletal protein RodZ
MRKWFWLAIVRNGKLRWPRWYVPVLVIFLTGILAAGLIYSFVVFKAVTERSHSPYVHTHSSR